MIWGKKNAPPEAFLWFAWFPVKVEDGRWFWFEHVWAEPYEAVDFDIIPQPVLAWKYHAVGSNK